MDYIQHIEGEDGLFGKVIVRVEIAEVVSQKTVLEDIVEREDAILKVKREWEAIHHERPLLPRLG